MSAGRTESTNISENGMLRLCSEGVVLIMAMTNALNGGLMLVVTPTRVRVWLARTPLQAGQPRVATIHHLVVRVSIYA